MIYLASASPRRARLLKEAGIRFQVLRSDYHERNVRGVRPSQLVKQHALGKALSAASRIQKGSILAADTIVYAGGKIIGKPAGLRAAEATLLRLQGRWHTVYTGVAYLEVDRQRVVRKRLFFEKTRVLLKGMATADIRRYFKRVHPLDKAGAYAIQDQAAGIVQRVKGSFSNAVGLPMERLRFL
jgi:septum formation protein